MLPTVYRTELDCGGLDNLLKDTLGKREFYNNDSKKNAVVLTAAVFTCRYLSWTLLVACAHCSGTD